MKKNRRCAQTIVGAILALTICLLGTNADTLHVSAGASRIKVDNTSLEKGLVDTKWNSANGDIQVKNGKIVFSKDSTAETRLITREPAEANDHFTELFNSAYKLKIKKIPKNQKFVAGYSLRTVESYSGDAEQLEVVFTNKGGIKVSVVAYTKDEKKKYLQNQ